MASMGLMRLFSLREMRFGDSPDTLSYQVMPREKWTVLAREERQVRDKACVSSDGRLRRLASRNNWNV